MPVEILTGDCREVLRHLPDNSVHCCVTSPPYFGLRDYGNAQQLGLEKSPAEYVKNLMEVFREVRRTLRPDGTLWLNLGDSYAGSGKGGNPENSPHQKQKTNAGSLTVKSFRPGSGRADGIVDERGQRNRNGVGPINGVKAKDLIGIPWMVAFALRQDGWYLRQDIIWSKPNPMPESVRDRCTKSHEYLFLLSKSQKYYFDCAAISEDAINAGKTVSLGKKSMSRGQAAGANVIASGNGLTEQYVVVAKRNRRSVWNITPKPYKEAHFATFPPELVRPCILAGSPEKGIVLDPFGGAGTTGLVAQQLNRSALLIELNPDYVPLARKRLEEK